MKRLILANLLFCLLLVGLSLPAAAESLSLHISGVDDEELSNVLYAVLQLPEGIVEDGQLNQLWLERYRRQLAGRVSKTLQPYGYFNSAVQDQLITDDDGSQQLLLTIDPGPPLRVTKRKITIAGEQISSSLKNRIISAYPLSVGQVLRQDLHDEGKAHLKESFISGGYLDAHFSRSQILVSVTDKTAEIFLDLVPGRKYVFGETSFSGYGDYPVKYMKRYLAYQPGEDFSQEKLSRTHLNYVDSELFDRVVVEHRRDQAVDRQVPIDVSVEPAPRHRLRPGIGYGTDTGARVSLDYRNLNLFRLGHELQGNLLLAERKQAVTNTYVIPHLKRLDTRTLVSAGWTREETDSYLTRETSAEVEYQRMLSSRFSTSFFLRFSQEYSEIADQETTAQMLLPGVRLTWRYLNDSVLPSRGAQLKLQLLAGDRELLSDTSLAQILANVSVLQPLPFESQLFVRLKSGATYFDDPFSEVPASLRFFAGGDQSVRGYGYQSLGPTDSDGEVIGGRNMLVYNLEFEKKVTDNWGLALFYDAGNAFNSFENYELKQGAGIGVRRYTRIGAIRLDLARQMATADVKYRLHFSVGFGW